MKIAIISLYGNVNYGNKLQNFALQETLKKFNCIIETFENTIDITSSRYYDFKMTKRFPRSILSYLKFIYRSKVYRKDINQVYNRRTDNIINFDERINKAALQLEEANYQKIVDTYDYIVFGSDQVWNPYFTHNFDINLGTFIPKEKKVAYSASFGIDSLNNKQKKFYKRALEDFISENISVREEQGNRIINNLIGKDIEVVLDPTMLMKKEEWNELIRRPEILPRKPFILTYVLGEMSEERKTFLNNFAAKYDYEIVNLMDESSIEYHSGVEEFLWYFSNSAFIFADSFHAGIFSILFEKPFYIMDREDKNANMNSRFDTLLRTFELEDRYLSSYNLEKINFEIDYQKVHKILELKRKESFSFLSKALKINEVNY